MFEDLSQWWPRTTGTGSRTLTLSNEFIGEWADMAEWGLQKNYGAQIRDGTHASSWLSWMQPPIRFMQQHPWTDHHPVVCSTTTKYKCSVIQLLSASSKQSPPFSNAKSNATIHFKRVSPSLPAATGATSLNLVTINQI